MPTPTLTCCPTGYTYVTILGTFFDYQTGTTKSVINTGAALSAVINKCCRIVNGNYAVVTNDPVISPIECGCCPVGYTYSDTIGQCVMNNVPKMVTPPVPCVHCVCVTPTPPSCPTCGTAGKTVAFSFDFTTRQCTDCTPQDNLGPSCIAAFLPPQYVDPILNFKLRNKNFI